MVPVTRLALVQEACVGDEMYHMGSWLIIIRCWVIARRDVHNNDILDVLHKVSATGGLQKYIK